MAGNLTLRIAPRRDEVLDASDSFFFPPLVLIFGYNTAL
jgi:hypothetical protein